MRLDGGVPIAEGIITLAFLLQTRETAFPPCAVPIGDCRGERWVPGRHRLLGDKAAVDDELGAGHERRLVGGEEQHPIGDLDRFASAWAFSPRALSRGAAASARSCRRAPRHSLHTGWIGPQVVPGFGQLMTRSCPLRFFE